MTISYLDRYNRAEKAWKALKFIAGRGVQSAELNELQSVVLDELYQIGRTVWSDGQVIRGCELTIGEGIARLSAGQVYFAGVTHDFAGGQIAITGSGEEIIGLRFTSSIVDESSDPTLFDPSTGYENSGYSGAHRLVYSLSITLNAADAVPLFAIQDGEWSADYRPQPQASEIAATLARRTFDESGDYLVRGLRCQCTENTAAQFWAIVGDGKAYVRGTEFTIPSRTRVALDKPTDTGTVLDEPKTYLTGTATYALNTTPVKAINAVTATVEKVVTITRGAIGGKDLMPYTPIDSIETVSQGETTYEETTDYLVDGNYIDWSPGGAEPTNNTSYNVTLRYIKQMTPITDYVQTGNSVDFSPSESGDNPVNGTTIYVDYDYYQSRHDLLVMTPRGELRVIRGIPGLFATDPRPSTDTLPIAVFRMAGNVGAEDVEVVHSDRYRLTMYEIAQLRDRIEDLEYNVSVTDLEQAAINVDLPTSKKAIFTDSFRNANKLDVGDDNLSCAIGVAGDSLDTLYPGFAVNFYDLSKDQRFIVRNYTHVKVLEQRFATNTTNVNPYAVYNNAGVLILNPPADIWIENDTVYTKDTKDVITGNGSLIRWLWWEQWTDRSLLSETALGGTSAAKTVAVTGSGYFPYSDNLKLFFDGYWIPLTPTGGTLAGTDDPGSTVRSNVNGEFTATFTVAEGTENGAHSVVIYNVDNTGSTQYLIDGRLRTWLEATTVVRHGERYDVNPDPVAQTFTVSYDLFCSAVDLFFGAKPNPAPPANDKVISITVSIRNTVNGYPGPQILAEKTLTPDQVSVSTNGATATRVTFDTPAYIRAGEEYAIVIATLSNAYYLHYATLGGRDLITNDWVLANPATGVMFTSANARAWTADQRSDLKFALYRADFGTDPLVVTFDEQDVDGSNIMIMASTIEPVGTDVVWEAEVLVDGEEVFRPWVTIPDNKNIDLGVMADKINVRATLNGTAILSPVLFGACGLVVAKWDADGKYISRNVELTTYDDLRVYIDVDLPAGTSVQPYYSVDQGTNWTTCGAVDSQRVVSQGWTENEYLIESIGGSPDDMKIKVELTSSSDRLRAPRVRRLRAIATYTP